ncbi:RusA family crossover junction endodeoxyribonuclease [Paraflavitalea sp. CAU 1676]|uniref:RusA family crossover junction endodeoxyribonuclease n=1 Tax=Paraflavitalea sp. CAU 1676 TaxID=3032598 RepID=UPI0023DA0926|nr:RusA family crossover junction endodeoxyribonuclease [Paraflavitalea sp. CAU 1676]MDF2189842.1 RusA family crossover junction endodeoxyribonuclease [Paraflavitalea sp. CAU 1676]
MIPFDFIVQGPPVSQQTKNRQRLQAWKQRVRQAAQAYWPAGDPPSGEQLTIIVTNFYENAAPDVDNIVKPIQDALIGLVYNDDDQLTDSITKKRNITGSFKVKGLSRAMADGFMMNADFVHVKVVLSGNFEEI